MATLKFAGFLLFGVLCFGAGVFALMQGDLGALGMFGFGVVCVAGAFMAREPKAPEEPLVHGSVTSHGRTFTGLIITFSRRRAVLVELIGIGFVATGIWIAIDRSLVTGIVVTALFGAMTLIGLVSLVRGAGRLVLTEDEIAHVAAGGFAAVRWADVEHVTRHDIRGTEFLQLETPGGAELSGWVEELFVRCVEEPAERRRVATGASAARDASPAASA